MQQIAEKAGCSVKTVSGALHGGNARMADATRERIHTVARELGYITNFAARATRQGWIPLLGVVADELITTPFATEIIRGLDRVARRRDIAVFATNRSPNVSIDQTVAEVQRFRPRAIAYAAMYHKEIALTDATAKSIGVLINCRAEGRSDVPAIVPDDRTAAYDVTAHLIARGRRRIAFFNLPGLLAGDLREAGFRAAVADGGLASADVRILPAVAGDSYRARAHSLADAHLDALAAEGFHPDAILAGNDRVAMDVYNALRRRGLAVPRDVAVAGFDNQVDIAARLDPPLTTMALPHRRMGQLAANVLLGETALTDPLTRLPFRLVVRKST